MHIETRGSTQIQNGDTGEVFEIEPYELDWEVVSAYERDMGPERLWETSVHRDGLGDLRWQVSEYPEGQLGSIVRDLNGHELISEFSISIEYQPYDQNDDPAEEFGAFDRSAVAEEMERWFLENYEDPANSLPYISREGGYQWINGGAATPNEALQDNYGRTYPFDFIEEVAARITDRHGIWDWSPIPDPRDHEEDISDLPPNGDIGLEPTPGVSEPEARATVLARLDALEQIIQPLVEERTQSDEIPGIGHNGPPEELAIEQAVSRAEWLEVKTAIDQLRAEAAKPQPKPAVIQQGQNAFIKVLLSIGGWIGNRLNSAIDNANGILIGFAIAHSHPVTEALWNAAQAVSTWVHTFPWPF